MRSHRPKLLLLLPLLASVAGCWHKGTHRESLTIDRTSPALGDPSAPVLLNDALTVYFSHPIKPLSVTEDSVTLVDDQGHQVRGQIKVGKVGSNWVTFVPSPPFAKDLSDGSFQPGGHYRLILSGMPRVDRVRSQDDRSLSGAVCLDVYVANHNQVPAGLPAILRPSGSELPLMLPVSDVPLQVAADVPRLQLHFTLPVLPSSLRPEAFRIRVLDAGVITPRSVRVVASPLDDPDLPGATIEIDLGALPQLEDGSRRALIPGDFLSVEVLSDAGLVDYSGRAPLPSTQCFLVVEGRSVPICEWPAGEQGYTSDDELRAGFEVRGAAIVPRVRVEAGNGSLGVFRPRQSMTLRPGELFDRGDGQQVTSVGSNFPFAAVDIPANVEVTVDASSGPVRLLALGGIRINGSLRLLGSPVPLPKLRTTVPVIDLIDTISVSVVAAGDIQVHGDIVSSAAIARNQTALLLASAGWLRLHGGLPFQSVLVAEARDGDASSRIEGVRGQSRPYPASFTVGLADGADFEAEGLLPWRRLPLHLDSGLLQIGEQSNGLTIAWQATAADAIRGELPDLTVGHIGRWQYARDQDVLVASGGAFVRLRLSARVRYGEPLPIVSELRLVQK